ncbi:unnamed protein product [Ixodes pacificus]
MTYLEASIKEAMRMYRGATLYDKWHTHSACEVPTPHQGGSAHVCIHYIEWLYVDWRSSELFLPQNKDNIRPFTNLAFGAGPRNCVGMRLAMVQAKVALASMLRHFKFHACPETMVPVRFKPRHMIPETDGPLILRLVRRNESE